ncbi:hypothetical protein [Mycoplasma sp. SG1]|uniref:hypothetical protein n=1 Tax=Mycoplasma sp. SG1 TaxID=2810348 RepID=UPI0020258990|nr:hypothetical protein [Mycoplasma sp. SG1]URM53081.1 hypothetical protein JRW51_01905 [Mycoplasma sp. SG1]
MNNLNFNENLILNIEETNKLVSYIKTQFIYGINVLKIFRKFLESQTKLNFKAINKEISSLKKLLKKLNRYLINLHIEDLKVNINLLKGYKSLVENYLLLIESLRKIFKSHNNFDNWLISNTASLETLEDKKALYSKIKIKQINHLFKKGEKILKNFNQDLLNISRNLEKVQKYLQ